VSVTTPVRACPHCGAANALDARFCLDCGEAIDQHEAPPSGPASGAAAATGGQRGGLIAVLIGLVLAAGAGAAYLASQDDDEGAGSPTRTEPASSSISGGTDTSATDTGATATDTTGTETDTTGTGTDTTATEPTATEPPPDDWPAGTAAYTVILKSDSQATMDRSEAESFAAGVTQGAAGVLNSDNYSSLRPGWWAVFLGQYDDADSAKAAAADLRPSYPGAYARYVAP
jgi:hypothetical protein